MSNRIVYSTDGSDPIFGGTTYAGAFNVSSTTTVKYAALDNVGNVESVHTRTIQVDDTAPSAPTLAFSGFTGAHATGSTVYFRPGSSGGFTVTPSSTDAQSGVASYSYPSLGTGWSRSGGDYTFDPSAGDPAEPNDVTAQNNAGLTSAATSFAVTVRLERTGHHDAVRRLAVRQRAGRPPPRSRSHWPHRTAGPE